MSVCVCVCANVACHHRAPFLRSGIQGLWFIGGCYSNEVKCEEGMGVYMHVACHYRAPFLILKVMRS